MIKERKCFRSTQWISCSHLHICARVRLHVRNLWHVFSHADLITSLCDVLPKTRPHNPSSRLSSSPPPASPLAQIWSEDDDFDPGARTDLEEILTVIPLNDEFS